MNFKKRTLESANTRIKRYTRVFTLSLIFIVSLATFIVIVSSR